MKKVWLFFHDFFSGIKNFFASILVWIQKRYQKYEEAEKRRDQYDFLPAYLDIIERPPAPWIRAITWSMVSFLFLVLIWAIVGKLDIHATATGRVIVIDRSKIIQPLEPGIVVEISVRDGQRVNAGDPLIKLNPVAVKADIFNTKQQIMNKSLEKQRLSLLLNKQKTDKFILDKEIDAVLFETHKRLLQREIDEFEAMLKKQDADLTYNQTNYKEGLQKIVKQEALVENAKKRVEAYRSLVKSNAISKVELLTQEKELLSEQLQLNRLQTEQKLYLVNHEKILREKESFIAQKNRDYRERLNKSEEELISYQQTLIKLQDKASAQILIAPISGIVQQLVVHTLGAVVTSAQQLMVIVPEDEELAIEAHILNKDIGFIIPGQKAKVKVDSFAYTRYGTLSAVVKYVSLDAIKDEKLGLIFPAEIKLLEDTLVVEDKLVRLSAGMSVNVEIKIGSRRVIDYFLSPLKAYQSESLRER